MSNEPALPLDTPEQRNPPRRPQRRDPDVVKAAAMSLLPDIIEWLDADWNEAERDRTIADLEAAIQVGADGYERCKFLDRLHWSCDAQLVEILDGADGYHELRNAVQAWVAANGIKAKFAVGDRVDIERPNWGAEDQIGTITSVKAETAEYVVATPKFLREHGTEQAAKGGGLVVAFEDCTLANKADVPSTTEAV